MTLRIKSFLMNWMAERWVTEQWGNGGERPRQSAGAWMEGATSLPVGLMFCLEHGRPRPSREAPRLLPGKNPG
jgi:hypothetical protein